MKIQSLTSAHKEAMRAIVLSIVEEQGMLPQFYWPMDLLGAEMASAEAIGAFEGDILVAFVLFRVIPGVWEVSLVATHPLFRRRGLMEAVFQHMILNKNEGESRQMWLEVHIANKSAQLLYEKLGFQLAGTRPRYYKDGSPALLYSLE